MVLVTGGTGLVGSHLLMELLHGSGTVRALYRASSDRVRVRELLDWRHPDLSGEWGRIEWFQADITDIPTLEAAFAGITEVYHCAAFVSLDPRDREIMAKVNFEGTRNVVNCSLAAGVKRFCHVSSIATIGGSQGTLNEENPWDPALTNDYATSKYLAEMEAWRGGQEGLQVVIVNPGVILGPGPYTSGSGRFFSEVAGGLRYFPPGNTGFVGVEDVVNSMVALTRNGPSQERFILVAENRTFRKLLSDVAAALGLPAPNRAIPSWALSLFWRLDWIRTRLTGKSRRLTRSNARSLKHPVAYSGEKLTSILDGFQYTPLESVLKTTARHFRKEPYQDQGWLS